MSQSSHEITPHRSTNREQNPGSNNAANEINQLVNLIDSELAISPNNFSAPLNSNSHQHRSNFQANAPINYPYAPQPTSSTAPYTPQISNAYNYGPNNPTSYNNNYPSYSNQHPIYQQIVQPTFDQTSNQTCNNSHPQINYQPNYQQTYQQTDRQNYYNYKMPYQQPYQQPSYQQPSYQHLSYQQQPYQPQVYQQSCQQQPNHQNTTTYPEYSEYHPNVSRPTSYDHNYGHKNSDSSVNAGTNIPTSATNYQLNGGHKNHPQLPPTVSKPYTPHYSIHLKNTYPNNGRVNSSGSSRIANKSYMNFLKGSMNPALLSNIAIALRFTIKLGTHAKGALEYPDSFTGADAVSTIHSFLPPKSPRHFAIFMACSLVAQSFFHPVNWNPITVVRDTDKEVYAFLNNESLAFSNWETDEDFPKGVFPLVTKCYSPTCGLKGKGCYSRICNNYVPGENEIAPPVIKKASIPPTSEIIDTAAQQQKQLTWIESVPKEVSDSVSKDEKKRQEIIYETIYTEEDYVKDLDLLETLFIKGLREAMPPIIPHSELESFIQNIFSNVIEIRDFNKVMYERLKSRQKESQIVEKIGDIFLESAKQFGISYVNYNGNFPIADFHVKSRKQRNPEFKQFLEHCSRNPAARKLDFRHFLQRPTTRLQRYTLLLEQVIKYTSDDNPDKEVLKSSLDLIKQLCRDSDNRVHSAEAKLKLIDIHQKLRKKSNEPCNELDLLNNQRQLLHKGDLQKKSIELKEFHVFLFDNYLVITKPKKGNGDTIEKYIVKHNPIPLNLLVFDLPSEVSNATKSGTLQYLGVFEGKGRRKSNDISRNQVGRLTGTNSEIPENPNTSKYPFTIIHVGRNGGSYQLVADSSHSRKTWKDKIIEAQNILKKTSQQIFQTVPINDLTFTNVPTGTQESSSSDHLSRGKVTCSAPFDTPEKLQMVAVGTEEGLWIGLKGNPKSFRKVAQTGTIKQISVIHDYGLIVLLIEKVLWAYSLEALLPSFKTNLSNSSTNFKQRLSNSSSVQYFSIGTIKDKTLVVSMKRKGLDSYFNVWEVVHSLNANNEKGRSSSRRGFGFIQKNDWFKEHKEFYVSSDSYNVCFLRTKLCIICARGFEIVDLGALHNINTIPKFNPLQSASIGKQCEGSKPLGIFRINTEEFLLCYEALFFYVNKYGELSRQRVVNWEGKPESVAMHYPYIIGFNSLFIEIWDIEASKMVQVIPGKNMRCLNDNLSNRDAIHAVMQNSGNDVQFIFELVYSPPTKK